MNLESIEYLAVSVPAVVLHEAAHVFAATLAGVQVKRLGISWKGPYIVREQGTPLANFFIALAGPAANLALGIAFWGLTPHFSLVNMLLGTYNLLPFLPGLDGHHAWTALRQLVTVRGHVTAGSAM